MVYLLVFGTSIMSKRILFIHSIESETQLFQRDFAIDGHKEKMGISILMQTLA